MTTEARATARHALIALTVQPAGGMSGTERSLLTPRLRHVPIGPGNAADLWLVHNDDDVVPWYDHWRPSRHEADDHARRIAESWRLHGVHKWMAYHPRPVRSSAAER